MDAKSSGFLTSTYSNFIIKELPLSMVNAVKVYRKIGFGISLNHWSEGVRILKESMSVDSTNFEIHWAYEGDDHDRGYIKIRMDYSKWKYIAIDTENRSDTTDHDEDVKIIHDGDGAWIITAYLSVGKESWIKISKIESGVKVNGKILEIGPQQILNENIKDRKAEAFSDSVLPLRISSEGTKESGLHGRENSSNSVSTSVRSFHTVSPVLHSISE